MQAARAEEFGEVPLRWGQIGTGIDAVARDKGGFAAVHGPDRGRDRGGQRLGALAGERELRVEYDSGGAARDGRGRGVRADASRRQDRDGHLGVGQQSLEQYERGQLADPAACLVPLGHDPDCPGGDGGRGLGGADDLGPYPAPAPRGPLARPCAPVLFGEQNGVHRGGQFGRGDPASGRYAYSITPSQPVHRGACPFAVPAEIQQAQRAGPFRGRDHRGVGLLERAEHDDEVPA